MYTITELANGRFSVKSSKGRTWKTTYPNRTSAEKGIAYVEKRFGGSSASVTSAPQPQELSDEDTAQERKELGIPPKVTEEEDEAKEAGW